MLNTGHTSQLETSFFRDPSRLTKTIGYYGAFIILGLVSASLGPTLPGLAANTRADLGKISFLFTARALGYLLGSLSGGRMYDRLPGHPVMAAGLGMMALTLVGVPFISTSWLLTSVFLIVGMVESVVDVGGNTLIGWVHGPKVGPFMNALHFFFGVGAFLSPLIVAWTMHAESDVTWAYWTLALCILPVAVSLGFLPNPRPASVSTDSRSGQMNAVLVAGMAVFLFLYTGAEVSAGGWIFTYARQQNIADATHAAYLTSAFWGALTVGRLLSIPIATVLRSSILLFSNLIGGVISLGVILLAPKSLIGVWIGTLGLGLAMASIFPTALAFIGQRMRMTGQVTGLLFVGASAGAMIIPYVIGQTIKNLGPTPMIVILLSELAAAMLVLFGICIGLQRKQLSSLHVSEQPAEAVL